MMAPVIFYMFLNSFGTLVLGHEHITTLVFKEKVRIPHHGASKNEVFLSVSSDRKMVFIKSLGKPVDTNLSIPTTSGKLYSFRIVAGKRPHSIVRVMDGEKDSAFKRVFDNKNVTISEGRYSLRLSNRSKAAIKVNSIHLNPRTELYLPKGPAVFINGERFYQ